MSNVRESAGRLAQALAVGTFFASTNVSATNDALQDLFFAACVNPTGALAARCNQTDDALGNLSGDSETSLNPSQVLSAHQQSTREKQSRSDGQDIASDSPDFKIELGNLGLTFSTGRSWETFDREQDADNERGYDADGEWALLGADYSWSDSTVVGALLNWEATELDYVATNPGRNFEPPPSSGDVESDSLGLSVFVNHFIDDTWYVNANLGFNEGDRTYRRSAVFQESNRVVPQTNSFTEGKTDTSEVWGSLLVGADWARGAWSFGATAELSYVKTEIDAYEERDLSGTGLAMAFTDASQTSVFGRVSALAQRAVSTDFGVVVPYGRVGWVYDFRGDGVEVAARYLLDINSNFLDLNADGPDTSYGVGNLGVVLVFANNWSAFIEGEYWAGFDDLDRHSVSIGLRKDF